MLQSRRPPRSVGFEVAWDYECHCCYHRHDNPKQEWKLLLPHPAPG